MWRGGWGRRFPPRFPTQESFDGRFNFCRLMYTSAWREPSGSGWNTDYPGADLNFPIRLGELTKTTDQPSAGRRIATTWSSGRRTRSSIQCPFLLASDVGTVGFDAAEVAALRAYFDKGGFLWVDDFWGERAWQVWVEQVSRILPPSEYPIEDVPPSHPLWRTVFEVEAAADPGDQPLAPHPAARPASAASRRAVPDIKAIYDRQGRIMVAHDPRHRHLGLVGAGRRGSGVLLPVLTERLRAGDQRRDLRDEPLTGRASRRRAKPQPCPPSAGGVGCAAWTHTAGSSCSSSPPAPIVAPATRAWAQQLAASHEPAGLASAKDALDVLDFEEPARRMLPPAHWGYMATGVGRRPDRQGPTARPSSESASSRGAWSTYRKPTSASRCSARHGTRRSSSARLAGSRRSMPTASSAPLVPPARSGTR